MPNRTHAAGPRGTSRPLVSLALCVAALACVTPARAAQAATKPKRPPAQKPTPTAAARDVVSPEKLLRIVRAEDERRWEASDLGQLLNDAAASVRRRAALAAGRIGDEGAVAPLIRLLRTDRDERVRATAAFALGEIESDEGSDALAEALRAPNAAPTVRARAVEALGKIAAALPEAAAERKRRLGEAVLAALSAERAQSKPSRLAALLGLTAVLRARPADGPRVVALFLDSKDARVRADAANTLTRLRAKVAPERLRSILTSDTDPVARSNAARALGAAEDAASFEALLTRATVDPDTRVRVSALRSLAQLKDARAAGPLLRRAEELFMAYKAAGGGARHPTETNELLELAAALGRLLQNSGHERASEVLRTFRAEGLAAPEVEVALARIAPVRYVRDKDLAEISRRGPGPSALLYARKISAAGQGLGEIAGLTSALVGNSVVTLQADAQIIVRSLLEDRQTPALAVPDLLRSLAAFKPPDLDAVARAQLKSADVVVRATAADILSELPPSDENARALAEALPRALQDEQLNDAALSTLGALARQRGEEATAAVRSALETSDYLVRRRAADILRERAGGAAGRRIETVNTRNREADYARALARVGKTVRAVVHTDKGAFTIELLPEEAPLTVDNFVQLARRNYFNNVSFHRVVPNFVVQGGDPRGDGNGGPGYQIRCEINTAPYERGAVGMALSGKDTGGSQWFVTHSPQPHLDGGYTVFGNVVGGMEVVDRLARGDLIRSVVVTETRGGAKPAAPGRRPAPRD